MVSEIIANMDDRYRSRKWLLAAFVLGFASVVVLAVVAAHMAVFIAGLSATVPPLMPVLWWWSSVSAGVLSLYGATEAISNLSKREK